MKVFSLDAETNGLYGDAFAIAAVVTEDEGEVARFIGRCPIVGEVDDFVKREVLPVMGDIEETLDNYHSLLEAFWEFYKEHKEGADVIAHVGHPVESKILRDMVGLDFKKRLWEGPFPLKDVSNYLDAAGYNSLSLDHYIGKNDLTVPFKGDKHNPLYDCIAAEVVYRHLKSR